MRKIATFIILMICLGTIRGQTTSDSTIQFLTSFYNYYLAYCCYDDNSTSLFDFLERCNISGAECTEINRKHLIESFCTIEFVDTLNSLLESYSLDYDPFINAQFCPEGIYSFSISQTDFPRWYQMKYYDEENNKHCVVHLKVTTVSGFCKISNVRDFHQGGYSDIIESDIDPTETISE